MLVLQLMDQRGDLKKMKHLRAKYWPLSKKHLMAKEGSKQIEMEKDETPPGEVRTLGKKHQGAKSQEAKFANQAHTKGKQWRPSNEKKLK